MYAGDSEPDNWSLFAPICRGGYGGNYGGGGGGGYQQQMRHSDGGWAAQVWGEGSTLRSG